jgi:hypothetical protein
MRRAPATCARQPAPRFLCDSARRLRANHCAAGEFILVL